MLMSRFRNVLDEQSAHILTLRALIVALVGLNVVLAYGWYAAPKDLVIHQPPDLRSGSWPAVPSAGGCRSVFWSSVTPVT